MEIIDTPKAKQIIENLPNEFDTRAFIRLYMKTFEKGYVDDMIENKKAKNVFKATHSKIGKFLSDNKKSLNIKPLEKVRSIDIKGTINENQKWRKI